MYCILIKKIWRKIMTSKELNADLTQGKPFIKILIFSMPLIGGSIFQQLYNFIDTIIVSRFLGIDALAAIGAYYPLSFLVLGFIQGSCIGFSIPLSQDFGAKNHDAIKKDLFNGSLICLVLTLTITPLMIMVAGYLLEILNTPQEIMSIATNFTMISFCGIPSNILYNYSSSILRAQGDSKHPFFFLILSLAINIILALIFILFFNLGLNSIAIATVISEFFAGILNIVYYIKHPSFVKISLSRNFFNFQIFTHICIIGFPMGVEYSISALGAIVMQNAINSLGIYAVAAQSAGDKIRQLFTLPMESVGAAVATYMAQNYGSKQSARLKNGIKASLTIQIIWSLFSFILILFLKKPIINLVLGVSKGPVFSMTHQYLTIVSYFFIIHGSLMIFRNTLQGLGHSMYAVISGVGELIGRSIGGYLAITSLSYTMICYSNQLAWIVSLSYCVIALSFVSKKDTLLY
ncbi:MATE family efflux transporter [Pediococcus pentosaceus]|nr:MATE family efflux transporter [Pediococcus pentosaceus]